MSNAQPWLGTALLLLLGAAVGAGVAALASFLARRQGRDSRHRGRLVTRTIVIIVGAFAVLAIGRLVDPRLAEAALGAIGGRVVTAAPDIAVAVIIVLVGIAIASVLQNFSSRLVQPIRPGLADAAGKLGYWSVMAMAVIVAATQAGIAVGVLERLLLIVAGALALTAAVGIGLGSRGFLAAVVAGWHVGEIVDVGDEVEVDSVKGRVLAIGRASVRIDVDDAEAEVPHGRFLEGAVLVRRRNRETIAATTESAPESAEREGPART